jgi:hypothetical protein
VKNFYFTCLEETVTHQKIKPFYKIIMWMSVFLLTLTVEDMYSQGDTLNCASSYPCIAPWSQPITIADNMGSGITGIIKYRKRWCNGIFQIIIDEFTALDNGLFLDTLKVYHYNYTTFSDLVDIYAIQREYLEEALVSGDPLFPSTVVQIYKASCGVFLQCSYDIDSCRKTCDRGWDPPYPHDDCEITPVSIYRWHPCGTVCCRKTYQIYKDPGFANLDIIHIKNISIQQNPYTPTCTEQYKFLKPCENGC